MTDQLKPKLTRRQLLAVCLAGGIRLVGFDVMSGVGSACGRDNRAFRAGKQVGIVPFVGEPWAPLDIAMRTGLDGRLVTDLSGLRPRAVVTPIEKFYIRTRASAFLNDQQPWVIRVGGLVKQPLTLSLGDLERITKPCGLHLMECSGNDRTLHFGLLSVADWTGVPVSEILDTAKIAPGGTRVLISGFDRYPSVSTTSLAGASWIFTLQELESSGAFLALGMNGQRLTRDHGFPVRLMVPGLYGCSCIKWVDRVEVVGEDAKSTAQMQEFAGRTNQPGVPELARDYRPALIEQAAMPVRVEKWAVGGEIRYRVVGIVWGGSRLIKTLEIRFNPEQSYVPVENFKQTFNDPWSFWTHSWKPAKPGNYAVQLRVKDPMVPTTRLDSGHYVRSVDISEV